MNEKVSKTRDWLRLVQAEYLEMPGLHLTKAQVQRMWRFENETCDAVLEQLLAAHFLRQTAQGQYVLDAPSC